jgi:hypothetical protein
MTNGAAAPRIRCARSKSRAAASDPTREFGATSTVIARNGSAATQTALIHNLGSIEKPMISDGVGKPLSCAALHRLTSSYYLIARSDSLGRPACFTE